MNENKQIFGLRGNCWNTQQQKQAAETMYENERMKQGQ